MRAELAILPTVSPKGTSVRASLPPSPARQASSVLGSLAPHFSTWSHRRRTPYGRVERALGHVPRACGLCPLLSPSGPFSGVATKAEGLGRGHSSKRFVQEDSDLWVPPTASSVLSACWERTDDVREPFFLSQGRMTAYCHLWAMLCLGPCECSQLTVASPTSPSSGPMGSPTYSTD